MPSARYSAGSLVRNAWTAHRRWPVAWRNPEPRATYDAIVVGGGGHGLATAYYLAREFGVRRVAVLEKSWIGSGNSGRNTQVVRSNYYYPESSALYDLALRLYERMTRELNFNVMLRQGGHLRLVHDEHELESARATCNAICLNGVDARIIGRRELARLVPGLNLSSDARYPVVAGLLQPRGGIARHDAVVWAYARAADAEGVDIIQDCEVKGFLRDDQGIAGVETSRGRIGSRRIGLAVAAHCSVLAERAGFRLPVTCTALQAMVTEPVKPLFNPVVSSGRAHVYVSQSDRGELVFGGGTDHYPSYAQRGDFDTAAEVVAALVELFPSFSRLRLMRQWSGTVDITPDRSPILGASPVPGLLLNCGWGTGGFKAIPAGGYLFAHHLARGEPHELAAPFGLQRFRHGRLLDESAAAGVSH